MAIELTYDIGQMRTYSNDDANKIIRYVELKLNGNNNDKIELQTRTVELAEPSDYSNFTDYNALSKEQVITWAKNSLGTDEITAWESGITECLNLPENTGTVESPVTQPQPPASWTNEE